MEPGADPKFNALGNASIDLGLKVGLDAATGGVWINAKREGECSRKYLIEWTQCETLEVTAR